MSAYKYQETCTSILITVEFVITKIENIYVHQQVSNL